MALRWVMGYIAAVCTLALILTVSVAFPTFFTPFFAYQYEKLNVAETIQVDDETLMGVTAHLLDYMRGRRDNLNLTAVVAGQEREFFSQREKDHMVDVLELYNLLFMVRNSAFWLLLLFLFSMALCKQDILFVLSRCCREVLAGFLMLVSLLAIVISINFDRAFTYFHLIFFNNDLWVLDPSVDLLINMVPLGFFADISIFIGLLMLSLSLGVIGLASLYLRKTDYLRR
jgi:integral membrane protein (TIGR01906 family)